MVQLWECGIYSVNTAFHSLVDDAMYPLQLAGHCNMDSDGLEPIVTHLETSVLASTQPEFYQWF